MVRDEVSLVPPGLLPTQFAPAERASRAAILEQARQILSMAPSQRTILDAVPSLVLILNNHRQIVLANRSAQETVNRPEAELLGMRPGEALTCVHADEEDGGCGTTLFCSACGAVRAILASQRGLANAEECRIVRKGTAESLDLRVWATPLHLSDEIYTIFSVQDIGDEKRRRALERIFFHDILNTVAGVSASAQLIRNAHVDALQDIPQMLNALTDRLIDEILSQRQLLDAENSELALALGPIDIPDLLYSLVRTCSQRSIAQDRYLRVVQPESYLPLITDATLLRRVLDNMLKNALEATPPGGTVTLGCQRHAMAVEFWVHNAADMPRDVQYQIFQRSFSTKGNGRGLGTYSIKLLSERYLQGHVSFESSAEAGTTFRAIFPLTME
jgi:signal transduction histidine kinase